jgi:hypothetical protein
MPDTENNNAERLSRRTFLTGAAEMFAGLTLAQRQQFDNRR